MFPEEATRRSPSTGRLRSRQTTPAQGEQSVEAASFNPDGGAPSLGPSATIVGDFTPQLTQALADGDESPEVRAVYEQAAREEEEGDDEKASRLWILTLPTPTNPDQKRKKKIKEKKKMTGTKPRLTACFVLFPLSGD